MSRLRSTGQFFCSGALSASQDFDVWGAHAPSRAPFGAPPNGALVSAKKCLPRGRGKPHARRVRSSTSPAFLGRAARRFLFVLSLDADLFQEWLNRLFAVEKFFDRHRDIASVALGINFLAQFHSGLFVEITVLRFFENGRHIG